MSTDTTNTAGAMGLIIKWENQSQPQHPQPMIQPGKLHWDLKVIAAELRTLRKDRDEWREHFGNTWDALSTSIDCELALRTRVAERDARINTLELGYDELRDICEREQSRVAELEGERDEWKLAKKCSTCDGDGYSREPSLGDEPCMMCEGTGKIRQAAARTPEPDSDGEGFHYKSVPLVSKLQEIVDAPGILREPHPECMGDANGEGHHAGDPDCTCAELRRRATEPDSGGEDGPTAEQSQHMMSWGGERGEP